MCCGAADILCLHFNEGRYTVMASLIQYILYLAVLVLLAIPLGAYIKGSCTVKKHFYQRF